MIMIIIMMTIMMTAVRMVETEVNLRIVTCSEGDAFFMMAMIVILLTITTFLPLYSNSAMNFRENLQNDFLKIRGGGVKGRLELF